jgi:hypothetical protein
VEAISKIFKSFNIEYKGLDDPLFHYFSAIKGSCENHPDLSLFYSKTALGYAKSMEDIVNQIKLFNKIELITISNFQFFHSIQTL